MPYRCFFVKTSVELFSFIPSADGIPSADTAVRRWRRLYAQGERTQWPPSAAGEPVFTGGNKRGQDTKYGFLSPIDSPHLPLDATPFGRASKSEGPTVTFGAPRVHP